jgi:signal transduction histidine kinase
MISLPIRTRVAPIALLVAFAFVVVGFLRADREMAQSETDRADLTVSETATLVEVFLLRHLAQLRDVERMFGTNIPNDSRTDTSLTTDSSQIARVVANFDAVWVTDSTLTSHAFLPSSRRSSLPRVDEHVLTTISPVLRDLVSKHRIAGSEPTVVADTNLGTSRFYFLEAFPDHSARVVVATVMADSLVALLRQNVRAKSFTIVIRSRGDTVLSLPGTDGTTQPLIIERAIQTPFEAPWTLLMSYTPSGRGVRIALWIVGLGAIVGLGIGLLLERREASRIADRSSELEHLSTELLRANRAKSEFLANVSHELRTPLNAIVGFVDLLRDGVYGALNSRQVGPVERIEASANHLRHLVDQVLDLAKMAAGRLEVHSEPIELRPFVFDVASEVEPLMTEKGLSFSLAVGTTLPRVRTDPTHLRQILINLLGNAVKFTSIGGISIRGKLVDTEGRVDAVSSSRVSSEALQTKSPTGGVWIALQVADSGIGISKKDSERIFDEFEQVNAGPRGDSIRRGTGLGLSISRRLARLLGGDITVESELGRGSVFTVWLRVDPADLRGDKAA